MFIERLIGSMAELCQSQQPKKGIKGHLKLQKVHDLHRSTTNKYLLIVSYFAYSPANAQN